MRSASLSLPLSLLLPAACLGLAPYDATISGGAGSSGSSQAAGSSGPTGTSDAVTTGMSSGTGESGVLVSGDAFAFTLGTPYGRIVDATVRVVELPEITIVTDAMGHFEFPSLPAGGAATFEIEHAEFPRARTRTFTLPDTGELSRVTFQVPDLALFAAMAGIVEVEIDPGACQIVSTVTRVGKSIYDPGAHGEAGATVTISPALPAPQGPIYFNASVIPDKAQTETSSDGGVLFVNAPPGTYELQAHKDGVEFEPVTMQCAAGVLANASPPHGLQALP